MRGGARETGNCGSVWLVSWYVVPGLRSFILEACKFLGVKCVLLSSLQRMDRTLHNALFDGRMQLSSVAHWAYQGQNLEELKHLLFYITLELESTRLAAKDEIKRHEETERQLVHLLKATCRERDEARDQCQKLQEKLLQRNISDLHSGLSTVQPDSPAGRSLKGDSTITECDSSSGTYRHHSFASSPAQSMFDTVSSIQEPSKLNLADSNSLGLLQQPYFELTEEYQQSPFPAQNMQPVHLPLGCNTSTFKSSEPRHNLELQHKSLSSSSTPSDICQTSHLSNDAQNVDSHSLLNASSSFPECNLPADHQAPMQSVLNAHTSGYESDVQCQQQGIFYLQQHVNEESKTCHQQQATEHHSQSEAENQDQATPQKLSGHLQSQNLVDYDKGFQSKDAKIYAQFTAETELGQRTSGTTNALEQMTALAQESIVTDSGMTLSRSLPQVANHGIPTLPLNALSSQTVSGVTSSTAQSKSYRDLPSNVVPVHLPEPPEADPQVIMKSLPEKGKLLQAVMKAGPLLQTLLLAGPLPQWRHPPPPLDSFEIPLVSIPTSNVVNPMLKPPQLNAPVHDATHVIQSSPSVFCSLNQSEFSKIPLNQSEISKISPGAFMHSSTSTSSSSNKRSLLSSPINGDFVQNPRPSLKYAKLQ